MGRYWSQTKLDRQQRKHALKNMTIYDLKCPFWPPKHQFKPKKQVYFIIHTSHSVCTHFLCSFNPANHHIISIHGSHKYAKRRKIDWFCQEWRPFFFVGNAMRQVWPSGQLIKGHDNIENHPGKVKRKSDRPTHLGGHYIESTEQFRRLPSFNLYSVDFAVGAARGIHPYRVVCPPLADIEL